MSVDVDHKKVDPKQVARKDALTRRGVAHEGAKETDVNAQASRLLTQVLSQHQGQIIAGYMPIRSEIDPRSAMHAVQHAGESTTLCLPVVEAQAQPLRFDRWDTDASLIAGAYGALIPSVSHPVQPNVVIVPLVAFNRAGHRLGYGGGYYDRTLEQLRQSRDVVAIGFAYSAQEMDDFPVSNTDAPLDIIVTENEVITF